MNDNEIITLYENRHEKAIIAGISKYGHYCTTVSLRIVGNPLDTEECVNYMLTAANTRTIQSQDLNLIRDI